MSYTLHIIYDGCDKQNTCEQHEIGDYVDVGINETEGVYSLCNVTWHTENHRPITLDAVMETVEDSTTCKRHITVRMPACNLYLVATYERNARACLLSVDLTAVKDLLCPTEGCIYTDDKIVDLTHCPCVVTTKEPLVFELHLRHETKVMLCLNGKTYAPRTMDYARDREERYCVYRYGTSDKWGEYDDDLNAYCRAQDIVRENAVTVDTPTATAVFKRA